MLTADGNGPRHRHKRHHHHRHHHHRHHKRNRTSNCGDEKERIPVCSVGRVLRNRRYRRPFEDHRHTKRLFTPEIKRFLKSWLVRRRDNPYPSRDEKKSLAVQTGLTYIQICNWFANWRRKLKNAGGQNRTHTWSNLIKSYNTQAHGNVEQFSLGSDDSIWEEPDLSENAGDEVPQNCAVNAAAMDHSYSATAAASATLMNTNTSHNLETDGTAEHSETVETNIAENNVITKSSKYKSFIIEKYLTDLTSCQESPAVSRQKFIPPSQIKLNDTHQKRKASRKSIKRHKDSTWKQNTAGQPLQLSKWLESAARFKPNQSYVRWTAKNVTWKPAHPENEINQCWSGHHKEELDAAEALTRLSALSC